MALGKATRHGQVPVEGGRGGARHFAKPYVDSGLVVTWGPMSSLAEPTPDPKGLVQTMPLWAGLLRLESSGEIHSQPMRTALITLLAEAPEMNATRFSGQAWVNIKLERLNTMLYHVRKLGRESLTAAAAKLTREEFKALQNSLQLLSSPALEKAPAPERALEEAPALEKATALEKAAGNKRKSEALNKKLKQNDSDATMDSQGFPRMFGESPEKAAPNRNEPPAATSSFNRRRNGNKAAPLEKGELHKALGFGAKKRPASAMKTTKKEAGKPALEKAEAECAKRPASTLKNKRTSGEKEGRKPWLKIRKTQAQKQLRAYLVGTTQEGGKLKLIVEVSANRCPDYSQVIDEIWTSLEKDALTKAEALELKEKLCKQRGY